MYRKQFRTYTPCIALLSEVILLLTTKAYCISTTTTTTTTTGKVTTPSSTAATTSGVTTLKTVVTTKQPELGSDCLNKGDNWCNDNVAVESICGAGGRCVCDPGTTFKFSPTTCMSLNHLKPMKLRIKVTTPSSMTISWEKATEVSSLPDIVFSIKLVSHDDSHESPCEDTTSTTVECSGLTPGHKYSVTVTATYGGANQSVSITDSTKPSKPGELLVSGEFIAPNVTLRWHNATGRVDYYILKVWETDTSFNSTNNSPEVLASGLEPGKVYNVNITAYSHGERGPRRKGQFETKKDTYFGTPRNLTVVSYNATSVCLEWQEPTEFTDQNIEYSISYTYQLYPDGSPPAWNNTGLRINQQYTTVQKLIPGAYYHFRVYTVKDGNDTYAYTDVHQQTLEKLPGPVNDINITSVGQSLLVQWTRPDRPFGCITHYLVRWNEEGEGDCDTCLFKSIQQQTGFCENSSKNLVIHDLSYTINNLEGNTTYKVSVQAFTKEGGGNSTEIIQTTNPSPPNPIHDLEVTNVTETSITVKWNIISDDIFTFKVCLDDLHFNTSCSFSCETKDSVCVFDGLEEYWNYTATVHALGTYNFTKITDNIRTRPAPPGLVGGCSVETYASDNKATCDASKATVKWKAPNITERNSLITHYKLSVVGQTDVDIPENHEKQYTFRNIPAENNYIVKIRAVSSLSNERTLEGNWYNVTFETGKCAPPRWSSSAMKLVSATPSGITLSMDSEFFINDSQGRILQKGIIVSPNLNNKVQVIGSGTYSNSKSRGFREPYRINFTDSMDDGNVEITIGDGSGCRPQPCNGPLPEDLSFHVMAFACTGNEEIFCRSSISFGPFKTSSTPPDDGSSSALIVVTIVLLIAVIFLTSVVLWRKGIIDPCRNLSKSVEIEQQSLENKREHYTEIQRKRPIMLSEFEFVLSDLHRDSNLKFSDQYEDILKLSKIIESKSKFEEAGKEENKPKNRWVNILPFDHSRVKLQQLDDDDPSTDYINANYIPGYHHRREYIATQGPLPGTVDDFWRMVWEQNAAVIVMLTKCKEGNRVKCEQYWPTELREPKQYWNVVVNLISISTLDKFNLSIFNLTMKKEKRQVMHFHYQDFPDFSANVEMDNFIEFTRTVRNHVPHEMRGPLIVHCSAGVGRSGTYIAIDRLLQFLGDPDFSLDLYVDIFDIVMSMRENRVTMVQTESQYVMIFDCFHKMLEEKKREILANISLDSDDKLYANQCFEPYPEVVYENITNRDQHHQLEDEDIEELQTTL